MKTEFIILTHRVFWKSTDGEQEIFKFKMEKGRDSEWVMNFFKKLYDKKYFDIDLENGELITEELPKPNTFPKFNNEKPFEFLHGNKVKRNLEIVSIRWNGDNWEYQLKNIGHKGDFQPENLLKPI